MRPWNTAFGSDLDRAGVRGKKHIPSIYLRAGWQQRVDLLRGLMDTDGWFNVPRHRAGFTTTSDDLAGDVLERPAYGRAGCDLCCRRGAGTRNCRRGDLASNP